jgi:hypothetical protein
MGDIDSERLAVLETRLEALPRIEAKLDALYEHYPTRAEMNERFSDVRREIELIRDADKINRINWPVWVVASMAALSWITQLWPKK